MVTIAIEYRGGLRCEAVHEPSGSRVETDAPVDNHGQGARFSPTDLVGAALGGCIATILGILADRKGWDLRGMRLQIEKHMSAAPRRIARLPVTIHMPLALGEEDRALVEYSARTCPVMQSLRADIDAALTFRWPDA